MHKVGIERVDFTRVAPEHDAIHAQLENWARWVAVRGAHWMSPIWRLGKPMGRQWNAPQPRVLVDNAQAMATEQAVSVLPEPHRSAIRWSYVYKHSPARQARALRVRYDTLARLVEDGRTMLEHANNEKRGVCNSLPHRAKSR